MSHSEFLVTVIVLVVAASFLALWMRRDRGVVPEDRLADALHGPRDGRS
jgi:hypothetical protein